MHARHPTTQAGVLQPRLLADRYKCGRLEADGGGGEERELVQLKAAVDQSARHLEPRLFDIESLRKGRISTLSSSVPRRITSYRAFV